MASATVLFGSSACSAVSGEELRAFRPGRSRLLSHGAAQRRRFAARLAKRPAGRLLLISGDVAHWQLQDRLALLSVSRSTVRRVKIVVQAKLLPAAEQA
ncbi:hypothetical protein, partial [Streptomyces mirabilis]|uniref:hypothetical protein n=1 Tax=Streptomyces mirabilis TaxID=68239 RepID=UPI00365F1D0B